MSNKWTERIIQHHKTNPQFSLRDFQSCLTTPEEAKEFATMLRQHGHKPLKEFIQTSNDWHAFIPPALLSTISSYGIVDDLPANVITNTPESRESVTKRFVWKSTPVETYLEGEPFKETYIEGATSLIKWRKVGAKISETREAAMDLPLSVMQMNAEMTMNEFKAHEWKQFTHELHNSTSNQFNARATLKNGEFFDVTWANLFDNTWSGSDEPYATWSDIKNGRAKMLRRARDAVRPTVAIVNATTEANLADTLGVNNSSFLGSASTFFATGSLPNIYGLTFVVIPDAFHGYFTNDITRKNDTFTLTNDVFLLSTNNGPTILRHTREPLSTETWYDMANGQKNNMNLWERYEYSTFRHTNILRIKKAIDEYGAELD